MRIGMYHYTVFPTLPAIRQSGQLLPSVSNAGLRGLLWFSMASPWEPSAGRNIKSGNAIRAMEFKEQREKLGCARFKLTMPPLQLYGWDLIPTIAGMSRELTSAVERVAAELGSDPRNWRATPHAIDVSNTSLEIWLNGHWGSISLDRAAAIVAPAVPRNWQRPS